MSAVLGYRAALYWLLDNDDTGWLDDVNGSPSVTLSLLADIYGRTTELATGDLRRIRDRRLKEAAQEARAMARAARRSARRTADRIDGYDRDDLGESADR